MAIKDRIKEARLNKKLTQEQLASLVGVAKSTITGYEKGNSEPSIETMGKIMSTLDVDANFLWQDETDFPIQVSYTEMEHIKKYRFISTHSPEGASVIDTVLDREYSIAEQLKSASSPAAIIEFHDPAGRTDRLVEYFHNASAGGGVFILGNEAAEQIEIPDTPENRSVDFAIKVSGESMEPDYLDGDIVLVSQKAELSIGDVGIFIINSKAYIKEYGAKELISRNPKSPNVQIAEYDNIVCMGKVTGKL